MEEGRALRKEKGTTDGTEPDTRKRNKKGRGKYVSKTVERLTLRRPLILGFSSTTPNLAAKKLEDSKGLLLARS